MFLLLMILLGNDPLVFAQGAGEVGKISLSVVMPENVDGLDVSQLSRLESKIVQMVTLSGLSASGYQNNFVIYPRFAIYENNVVEGGMHQISVVDVELNLFIKQVDNNLIFSSWSKRLKGSGGNRQLAVTNAISKVQIGDPEVRDFIGEGKLKIIRYYESRCMDIMAKSDRFVKMQQFEQAFGLLMTVPEEVSSCYNRIQNKAIEAYKAYQTQKCSELIQKAKTTLAANDYVGSLNILSEIDPSASCFREAQSLARSAELKVDAEEKKQWDFRMRQYKDAISLERLRIQTIREIAVSYYRSQSSVVHYNYIIR